MNLRGKLLVSFSIFLISLLTLGVWSAWRLRAMGETSRLIIADNYQSVVAAQQMKESLERQDSAVLFLLFDQRDRATQQARRHRELFDDALERAARNITEEGEVEIIQAIRKGRAAYYRRLDTVLAEANAAGGAGAYFSELEPLFNRLRADCDRLLTLNQEAMRAKSDRAERVAERWFQFTVAIVAGLVLAGIALAFLLAGVIVRPVRSLTETASKIAGGNLSARAPITSRDEIGLLAAEFNRMAERVQQVRRSDIGQLLLEQQTTEAALNSLFDPVVVTDGEGRIRRLNPAAEKIFGRQGEVIGKTVAEIAPDSRLAVAIREAMQSQRAVATETVASAIRLPVEGSTRAFRLQTTPMRDAEGQALGAIMLMDDITRLSEVDQFKSEFITTAATHLQAPLRDAQLGIHALLSEAAGELNDNQRDLLEACRGDCFRLERVMNDLLTLSRIESGESSPALISIDAGAMLRPIAEELRLQVEAAEITFTAEVDPALPALQADPAQVAEVLRQLVGNAIRHTPRGGEIRLQAARRDEYVAVSVSDTGCGIPPEYLPRIFDRFIHVPGTANGGTGLGLAISKRLIEAQHGQISVQSEPGRGATFKFLLPVAPVA